MLCRRFRLNQLRLCRRNPLQPYALVLPAMHQLQPNGMGMGISKVQICLHGLVAAIVVDHGMAIDIQTYRIMSGAVEATIDVHRQGVIACTRRNELSSPAHGVMIRLHAA
jgi:hypothetical protein